MQLTNASRRDLTVQETFADREFELHLVDSKGAEAPLTDYVRYIRCKGELPCVIFRNFSMTIKPGQTLKADEDIVKIYSFTEPGEYSVNVCRVLLYEPGPVLSNTVTLRLIP